jgi:cell division septal protein FtsQ
MPRRNKTEEADPREITRLRVRRALQFTGWTLAVVAVVFTAAWLFMRGEQFVAEDPRFIIAAPEPGGDDSAVTVTGARHASLSSILDVFADDRGRSLYRLDAAERRKALQRVEWVKDATVRRVWPNRVAVEIIERVPVAFLQAPARATGIDGHPVAYRPLLIDADGVLLTPRGGLPPNLPLVTGIRETDHPELRRDRVARAIRLLDALHEARENLDEIDVTEPENLKVTYRIHELEYVLALGDRDFGERFQRFMRGYPEWKSNLPTRTLIDLTHESRVITKPLPEAR